MRYKTEIYSNDVELPVGCYARPCFINWDYEIESRDYGIKDIYPFILSVELNYTTEENLLTEDDTKEVEHSDTIYNRDPWDIQTSKESAQFKLWPEKLEVDFDKYKVKIIF